MMQFCNSLTNYSRFLTREVKAGDLGIGGDNPIRVQSMTTTDTMDTEGTVGQSIRMIEAGCELVRITAPNLNDARNLEVIKKELRSRGYSVPLVADIHFTPNAAEHAARIVEKVRVNPGNYADKKKFEHIEYTDSAYTAELERIRERFVPLVKICKEYGTAMRVGTNHGSLSDRILSRYGDTPLGMVESALEFVRICEEEGYYDIVLSMKASNPQVMVQAYRLLVARMIADNRNYPLHLGVTEAGEGEDGRVKSAAGIGALLEDGLGDTIRVSLTEEPEYEIPVAKSLVDRYSRRGSHRVMPEAELPKRGFSFYEFNRRNGREILNIGGKNVPRVIADLSSRPVTPASLFSVGYRYSVPLDKWNISDNACDFIYTGLREVDFEIPGTLGIIRDYSYFEKNLNSYMREREYPLFTAEEYKQTTYRHHELNFVQVSTHEADDEKVLPMLDEDETVALILRTDNEHAMADLRRVFLKLVSRDHSLPVIIKRDYKREDPGSFQLYTATDLGGLLIDGFGDGVWIGSGQASVADINNTAFNILQATRSRISKTEYISCPSCGRTLFDLQETTARIRARTSHLKGIKIGIMGCIVNGPGEMADADYGYVGTGPGKVTLYKGREVVKKNVPSSGAVDALIDLIRQSGDWVDHPVSDPVHGLE